MALFLGTAAFADKEGGLEELGVSRRLDCRMSPQQELHWVRYAEQHDPEPPVFTFEIEPTDSVLLARCPMADEDLFAPLAEAQLLAGACFLHEAAEQGEDCYVHCTHGVSRSASVVLCYLVVHRGMSLLRACELLKSRRVKVSPGEGFVRLLLEVEERETGVRSAAEEVEGVLRRPWLQDFKAGKIKLSQYHQILP
eukprot:TRINITY_DN3684_c0_g1_i1.p1 TRINITY_DN3684_c0_g1~~TRINITY_DN3684_c0_g1_i1.p1  ORF type:complete len:196 (+),score=60.77 TRINITY_DN3684_c0_g1_i1:155-742(+)